MRDIPKELEDMDKIIQNVRNGIPAKCTNCKEGFMQPMGDAKTAICFRCDSCNAMLNIN